MHEFFIGFVGFPPAPFRVLWDEHVFHEFVQLVQVQVGKNRADHASYNVAKKVIEFSYQEEIPRQRLRAAYGDGFKGAPLRCQISGEGPFPQDTAMCHGQAPQDPAAQTQEIPVGGGNSHV